MDKATQDELAAGAAGTIELGGRTYLVSPPDDGDLMALRRYLRRRAQSPLQALLADPGFQQLGPRDRKAAVQAATAAQVKGGADLGKAAATDALLSPEGCRFLAWLSLRKKHPEVTLEALAGLITEANFESVFVRLDEATGMRDLGNSAGRPGSRRKG